MTKRQICIVVIVHKNQECELSKILKLGLDTNIYPNQNSFTMIVVYNQTVFLLIVPDISIYLYILFTM